MDYANNAYKQAKQVQKIGNNIRNLIRPKPPIPVPSGSGAPGAPGGNEVAQTALRMVMTSPVFWTFFGLFLIWFFFFSGLLNGGGGGPLSLTGGEDSSKNNPNNNQTPKTPGLCPSTSGNFEPASCKYLNPSIDLFSTSLSQSAIDSYINKYNPVFVESGIGDKDEFIRRVNYILNASKQAGLNPALFLGYWKSESLFGTKSPRQLGCTGDTFEEQVDCAVGINRGSDATLYPIPNCARSHDANSQGCVALKQIRTANPGQDDTYPVSYPIATFDDYAEAYGPFSHDPDGRKGNCTSTYNILLEVAKELSACTISSPTSPPLGTAPAPPDDVRQGIIDKFGITMNGFDQQHLQWAWEKFWETSNTNFPELVAGITIGASDGGSAQLGCAGASTSVELGQYTPGDFFKFILTHELGHVIQSCQPRSKSQFDEAINAYNTEGGISFYGNNASACNGTVNINENYADIIAYYLNPSAGYGSGPKSCGGPANPPNPFFSGSSFPLHYSVGKAVLGGSDI